MGVDEKATVKLKVAINTHPLLIEWDKNTSKAPSPIIEAM